MGDCERGTCRNPKCEKDICIERKICESGSCVDPCMRPLCVNKRKWISDATNDFDSGRLMDAEGGRERMAEHGGSHPGYEHEFGGEGLGVFLNEESRRDAREKAEREAREKTEREARERREGAKQRERRGGLTDVPARSTEVSAGHPASGGRHREGGEKRPRGEENDDGKKQKPSRKVFVF